MATYRLDLNWTIEITSEQIEAIERARINRGGTMGDIYAERRFLEDKVAGPHMDQLLGMHLGNRPSHKLNLMGAMVKIGSGGEFSSPAQFTISSPGIFESADVGRILHIKPDSTYPELEGCFKISQYIDPNTIAVEGAIPVFGANLGFSIHEIGEILVTIVSI